MAQFLLLVAIALVVAALVFGVGALLTGADPGLSPVEPDGGSLGLPGTRPLEEADFAVARFDTALRGYRMAQVDAAMARAAYDIGFKQELIEALQAEVAALRDGRAEDAEVLRKAREAAGVEPAAGAGEFGSGAREGAASGREVAAFGREAAAYRSADPEPAAESASGDHAKPSPDTEPSGDGRRGAEDAGSGKASDPVTASE